MTDRQRDDLMRLTDDIVRIWFSVKDEDAKTAKQLDKAIDILFEITSK